MNGQPILIGHHSEKRHRRDLDRVWRDTGKAIEDRRKAEKCETSAARSERVCGPISSDDPEAIPKLRRKLADLENRQEYFRAVNRIVRRKPKNEKNDGKILELVNMGMSGLTAAKLFEPPYQGAPCGIEGWQLSNNNANMRRIRERIADLEHAETITPEADLDRGAYRVVENAEENRLQLIFPGKPSREVREICKRHGFRWAPSQGAWQRQLNGRASYAETLVKTEIERLT